MGATPKPITSSPSRAPKPHQSAGGKFCTVSRIGTSKLMAETDGEVGGQLSKMKFSQGLQIMIVVFLCLFLVSGLLTLTFSMLTERYFSFSPPENGGDQKFEYLEKLQYTSTLQGVFIGGF